MKNVSKAISIIFITLLGSFGFSESYPKPSVEAVWAHHIQAWSARNLDQILSDYNDQSIMIVNGQVFTGKSEIRAVFQRLFEIFDHGTNSIDPVKIVDRIVYITWHFLPQGRSEFYGTDTFIIENGKITVQTIASQLYNEFPIE